MKRSVSFILATLISIAAFAQKGTVEAYSREDLLGKVGVGVAYELAEFADGTVYYKDGTVTKSRVNICAFDNSLRFISAADTLVSRLDDHVDFILAGDRKIVRRNGMWLTLLSDSDSHSLVRKKLLRIGEPAREGGYGSVPPSSSAKTSAADSHAMVESHSYGYLVSVDWSVSFDYYLVDKDSGKVTRAGRAAFLSAFPDRKDGIKSVIRQRRLDLDDEQDVMALFDYCTTSE